MDADMRLLLETYVAESLDNLATVERALLAREAGADAGDQIADAFRAAHTIKGNAGNLGFPAVAELAHVLEDVLERGRAGEPMPLTLLLHAVDALREAVPAAVLGAERLDARATAVLDELRAAARSTPAAATVADAADAPARPAPGARETAVRSLRIGVDRLDQLLDATGELAVARGRVHELVERLPAQFRRELLESLWSVDRLSASLQEQVMQLRMVPLEPVLRRYARTVRDVATAAGKSARLEVAAPGAELDTAVLERVREALTHLVRNAVDHGLETPAERRAAGKAEQGTVALHAHRDSGGIVIELSDDGRGLDRARIEARVREMGLCAEPQSLADAELHQYLFAPGFSTASRVTDLSGRGFGLDIVAEVVASLRGSVDITGTPGAGTTVTLRLPLTVAVIDGFTVGVADETYLVPVDAVTECVGLPAESSGDEAFGVLPLRGRALPFVRLRRLFGEAAVRDERRGREHVLVVSHRGAAAGLVVDALHGEGQAVIKPLGRVFSASHEVSGSTITRNGRVALILDVAAILRTVARETAGAA